jgi:hypothetical protein
LATRQHDPETFYAVSELERKTGFTIGRTGSLVQIIDAAIAAMETRSAQACLPF